MNVHLFQTRLVTNDYNLTLQELKALCLSAHGNDAHDFSFFILSSCYICVKRGGIIVAPCFDEVSNLLSSMS